MTPTEQSGINPAGQPDVRETAPRTSVGQQGTTHPMLSRRGFDSPEEALEQSHVVAGRYTCWGCGNAINSAPHVKERTEGGYGIYHAGCRA